MNDLSTITNSINNISYEIEYDKYLDMAINIMGMGQKQAQNWAKQAVEEQMQTDEINLKQRLAKSRTKAETDRILIAHAKAQANKALQVPAATPTGKELQDTLSNLFMQLRI